MEAHHMALQQPHQVPDGALRSDGPHCGGRPCLISHGLAPDSRAGQISRWAKSVLLDQIYLMVGAENLKIPFVLVLEYDQPPIIFCCVNRQQRYTVLINTWRRPDLLKKSVQHYSVCPNLDSIRVVWSDSTDPPSDSLLSALRSSVKKASFKSTHSITLKIDVHNEDNLNTRFKPLEDLHTNAIFSVDDDVVVPCDTLAFAFSIWSSAPDSMVGFVPRMHWLRHKKHEATAPHYSYGGWWSVWWTGTYSMVLSKCAFFHRKYLDLYTNHLPAQFRNFVTTERNCEDIAMSFLVANATGAPPIWVKGKLFEIGTTGISSLKGHSMHRTNCLNTFADMYGYMPLVASNFKAVDARSTWFW